MRPRAPLTVSTQLGKTLTQRLEQRRAESGPAGLASHGVDDQFGRLDTQRGHEGRRHLDDLAVDRRVGNAEHLDVELMELPIPPLLGPLIAKHRPQTIKLGEW